MSYRIGLISDTHIPEARESLWSQIYLAFRDVDLIMHAGDIHALEVLDDLEDIAPVYAARGNGEDGGGGREIQPEDPRVRYSWLLEFDDVSVGLTHYLPIPERPPNLTMDLWLDRFFPDKTPDVIISGDTHQEKIEKVRGILCVNPGSPTYPHNYDTQFGTIGFLDIDGSNVEPSIYQIIAEGIKPFDWDAIPPWKQ
ncbi:MAG: hypothetical protein CMD74_03105 [Gammaproteobacteria bacterium]|nr:hypothetical protein [Gammaproteobacteria bacterium]